VYSLVTKKSLLTTTISALLLSGCGDESSSTTPEPSSTFNIQAIDGYLVDAKVRIETDGKCDGDVIATTGASGVGKVSNEFQDKTLCITAVPAVTYDETRGIVTTEFELKAPAGATVISPMTDLVVDAMQEGQSLDEAKQTVQEAIANNLTLPLEQLSEDLLFGDYLSTSGTDVVSKQLEVIGETLVDNANLSRQQKIEVAKRAAEIIAASDLDDLIDISISIEVNGESGSIEATKNNRPTTNLSALVMNSIELNNIVEPVDLRNYFNDSDGEIVDYEVISIDIDELDKYVTIERATSGAVSHELTLSTNKAGTFIFDVFAIDDDGARSYPLTISYQVVSSNTPPTINEGKNSELQTLINSWTSTVGEFLSESADISELFVDRENDAVITASIDRGLVAELNGDLVIVSGTPTSKGTASLTLTANDSVNVPAVATFTFDVEEAEQPTHPSTLDGVWSSYEKYEDPNSDYTNEHYMVLAFGLDNTYVHTEFDSYCQEETRWDEPCGMQIGEYSIDGDIVTFGKVSLDTNGGTGPQVDGKAKITSLSNGKLKLEFIGEVEIDDADNEQPVIAILDKQVATNNTPLTGYWTIQHGGGLATLISYEFGDTTHWSFTETRISNSHEIVKVDFSGDTNKSSLSYTVIDDTNDDRGLYNIYDQSSNLHTISKLDGEFTLTTDENTSLTMKRNNAH
jgi:hypothetical protein